MKTFVKNLLTITLLAAFFMAPSATNAQSREYDDMYFNSSDRKKEKVAKQNQANLNQKSSKKQEQRSVQGNDSFSARNMNPEYVSRNDAAQVADTEGRNNYTEDDYFVEELNRNPTSSFQNNTAMANNFYGPGFHQPMMMSPWGYRNPYFNPMWGGGFYDPFWGPGFYDPFWGPSMGSGFHMNIGFSSGWGFNRWNRWGNPYYSPWGMHSMAWGGGFYDPFWGPTWGMGGWYPTTRVVYVTNTSDLSGRTVTRGARETRSSAIRNTSGVSSSTTGRLANYDGQGRTSSGTTEGVRTRDAGNRYSTATQSDYYNRTNTTRGGTYANPNQNTDGRTSGTYRQNNRGTTGTLSPRTNSTTPQRNSQTFRQRSSDFNQGGNSGTFNRSGNSGVTPNRGSGYTPSSPSRSTGGFSPSAPSRSSGGSYTPSRSSGGSSPAPSRSSGGSSPSRGGRGN
jgi:Ni/Co efflux regulator RcnB